MIEDSRHLEALASLANELQTVLTEFNARASGITDKRTLIELRLYQNTVLADMVVNQRRALTYLLEGKVEPVVHFAEAVLVGVGMPE